MSDSNLFDSLTVNGKKEFLKNSVQHRKGLKQPGYDATFAGQELSHTDKEAF